jgi:hypothetical protein
VAHDSARDPLAGKGRTVARKSLPILGIKPVWPRVGCRQWHPFHLHSGDPTAGIALLQFIVSGPDLATSMVVGKMRTDLGRSVRIASKRGAVSTSGLGWDDGGAGATRTRCGIVRSRSDRVGGRTSIRITPQHLFPWRKVGAGVGALERGSQAHRPTGSCGTQRIRDG